MTEKETSDELNKRAAELEAVITNLSQTAKALRQQAEKHSGSVQNIGVQAKHQRPDWLDKQVESQEALRKSRELSQ